MIELGSNDFMSFYISCVRAEKYVSEGVRWIYKGEGAGINTTFSQDLEPEYITIDDDDFTAYINLQVNANICNYAQKIEETKSISSQENMFSVSISKKFRNKNAFQ